MVLPIISGNSVRELSAFLLLPQERVKNNIADRAIHLRLFLFIMLYINNSVYPLLIGFLDL